MLVRSIGSRGHRVCPRSSYHSMNMFLRVMYIRLWRVLIRAGLVAISGSSRRLGFHFGRLLWRTQSAGAIVAWFFHIVVLRQRRDQGCAASQLADTVQDDFGAAVVKLHRAPDLDDPSCEPAHVTDVLQVGREDYDREGASGLILAEIHEVDALGADFHAHNLSRDAFIFADVPAGFAERETVRGGHHPRG